MGRFSDEYIRATVGILINGGDYRTSVINKINAEFFDFAIDFFKKIIAAKMIDQSIDLSWYKTYFINDIKLSSDEIAINERY